jgi:hypothetical protein
MKPVYVDWHHTDGHVESRLAYRLYDMNRDGHIDYMEILGPRGEVLTTHADLDFDGRVDKTTQNDSAH